MKTIPNSDQRDIIKKRQSLNCKKIVKSPLDRKLLYVVLFGIIGICVFIISYLIYFQVNIDTLISLQYPYLYVPLILFVGLLIMWVIVSYEKCQNK